MTEQELREKIKNIVHNELLHEDIKPFGDGTYAKVASKIASALIAEGLTFDKTTAILTERTNGKTLIHKAQYYDEMKHRAEVAERALYNMAYGEWQREGARRAICEKYAPSTARDYLDRAEKELAEERKDENY